MVLRMARPQRDPVTGIFRFRRAVPEALRPLVGKWEEKVSLGTRDESEARIAHARVAAEVESRWRELAKGVRSLTEQEAEQVAGEIYRDLIREHEDNPSKSSVLALFLDQETRRKGTLRIYPFGPDPDASRALFDKVFARHKEANVKRIDDWLARHGYLLDADSRAKVGKAVGKAVLQAREQLLRMAEGDYRPDPDGDRFPPFTLDKKGDEQTAAGERAPLKVFDDYANENEVAERTIKRWRPIVATIQDEVPDIAGLTTKWVIEWKDALLRSGLDANTIKKVHLACLKAVCGWAVTNERMAENPVIGVKLKAKKRPKLRSEAGFTNAEARTVLRAALRPQPEGLSPSHRRSRRWVPWICAYTGARVGEVAQLRKRDVQKRNGVWMILITPEAGTTKSGDARWVPVHPVLERQGFLAFVEGARSGPLFTGESRGGKTPPSERVGQHIATWVRSLGITDRDLQPSHGWRHRFKTLGRTADVRDDAMRYMQGHAPHGTDEKYGDHKARPLLREISKIPELDLDANDEVEDDET
jgi:integrase